MLPVLVKLSQDDRKLVLSIAQSVSKKQGGMKAVRKPSFDCSYLHCYYLYSNIIYCDFGLLDCSLASSLRYTLS
jgi:hypothetical protein